MIFDGEDILWRKNRQKLLDGEEISVTNKSTTMANRMAKVSKQTEKISQ